MPSESAPVQPILVVDDHDDIRDAITELLAAEGYPVLTATDGKDALRVVRSAAPRPGLILLDWMMPVMSGAAFSEARLKDPELRAIPVVVLSAVPIAAAELARLELIDWLKKPVPLEDLLALAARHAGAG